MRWVLFFFLGIVFQSCQHHWQEMPINAFSQWDDKNVVLVDVRTPAEFELGHLEGALNINWLGPDFAKDSQQLDHGKTIYVYCKMGSRSAKAARFLSNRDYRVVDLTGGYLAWKGKHVVP